MWRYRKILLLLRAYPYRLGANQGDKFAFLSRGLNEKEFVIYLYSRRYLIGWFQLVREFLMFRGFIENRATEAGVSRIVNSHHRIALALDGCREKGYLEPKHINPNLKLTPQGYLFTGWFGVGFFNEVFKEYGYTFSVVFGVVGATALHGVVANLWPMIRTNLGF
jgi:hypothetical protein